MANPTTPAQAQKLYPDPQSFASFLNQHWKNQRLTAKSLNGVQLIGNTVGDQWLNWYATESPNHLNYSLGDFEMVFFDYVEAQSLLKGLSAAETGTGQFLGQAKNALQTSNYLPQVPNPLSGLAAIGDFFSRLTQASTWLRLGEGILGIILIAVGIARMTHAVPAATKIARAVV